MRRVDWRVVFGGAVGIIALLSILLMFIMIAAMMSERVVWVGSALARLADFLLQGRARPVDVLIPLVVNAVFWSLLSTAIIVWPARDARG